MITYVLAYQNDVSRVAAPPRGFRLFGCSAFPDLVSYWLAGRCHDCARPWLRPPQTFHIHKPFSNPLLFYAPFFFNFAIYFQVSYIDLLFLVFFKYAAHQNGEIKRNVGIWSSGFIFSTEDGQRPITYIVETLQYLIYWEKVSILFFSHIV